MIEKGIRIAKDIKTFVVILLESHTAECFSHQGCYASREVSSVNKFFLFEICNQAIGHRQLSSLW